MNLDFSNVPFDAPLAPPPLPKARDPFDLAPVRRDLEPYLEKIADMADHAQALAVTDDETLTMAAEMAGQVKGLGKSIEDARKGFVAAPNAYVKSVNGLAKGITEKLAVIETGLKRKIGDYQQRKELERRKAEEDARRQAAALQKKLDAEARAANVEPVKVEAPAVPRPQTIVRTAEGTAYQHKEWRFEVEEEAAVPREYLMVDLSRIRQAVKDGIRNIPGVKIFEHTETRFRR